MSPSTEPGKSSLGIRDAVRRVLPADVRNRLFRSLTGNRVVRRIALYLPGRARISGGWFEIDVGKPDPDNRLTIWTGVHESAERELVLRHLVPGKPVVEIGAGIGTVTLAAWRASGQAQIVICEANPAVVPILRRNLARNGISAELVEKAIAYGSGTVQLSRDRSFWVGASVSDRAAGNTDLVEVPSATLGQVVNEFIESDGEFQLIMDIEGGEWSVFTNDSDLIRERASCIVAELHGGTNDDLESIRERARSVLGDIGFEEVGGRGAVAAFARRKQKGANP